MYEILCVSVVCVYDAACQYCLCMRFCESVLIVYQMLSISIVCV